MLQQLRYLVGKPSAFLTSPLSVMNKRLQSSQLWRDVNPEISWLLQEHIPNFALDGAEVFPMKNPLRNGLHCNIGYTWNATNIPEQIWMLLIEYGSGLRVFIGLFLPVRTKTSNSFIFSSLQYWQYCGKAPFLGFWFLRTVFCYCTQTVPVFIVTVVQNSSLQYLFLLLFGLGKLFTFPTLVSSNGKGGRESLCVSSPCSFALSL